MKINIEGIIKGISLIEQATQSPLVKLALVKLLPSFGLTPEEVALVESHHSDYVDWEAEARRKAEGQ